MGLNDGIIGRCTAQGAFFAEARNRGVDKPRIDCSQSLGAQVQFIHHPGSKVVNEDINLRNHIPNECLT